MLFYIIACISGIVLGLAWIVSPLFAFVGFVPMLYIVHKTKLWQYAKICYIFFLCWNVVAASWMPYPHPIGVVVFIIVSALMTLPMLLAYQKVIRTKSNDYSIFAVYWIAYEYIQYQWDFLWSWLTLGNCFGKTVYWIQWYEFTGVLGGSLFIWIGNLLILKAIQNFQKTPKISWVYITMFATMLFLAWSVSVWLTLPHKKSTQDLQVVLVQPNINPRIEKLHTGEQYISHIQQSQKIVKLAKGVTTAQTDLVIFPEAILGRSFEINGLHHKGNYKEWDTLKHFFDTYPQTTFIFGMDMHRWVHNEERNDDTAFQNGGGEYMKKYNVALLYQKWQPKKFHYKSKRVPSEEYIPAPNFLKRLIPYIPYNITTSDYVKPLENKNGLKIGTLICYESTYGAYVSQMSRKGADILAVITEDGYWLGTNEPEQHFYLDKLRAIENRRTVLRASSMGFSCVIDKNGQASYVIPENISKAVTTTVKIEKKLYITFYARYGDYIGVLMFLYMSLSILFYIYTHFRKGKL
jgi:apolipoprotein N-acyltransferase